MQMLENPFYSFPKTLVSLSLCAYYTDQNAIIITTALSSMVSSGATECNTNFSNHQRHC